MAREVDNEIIEQGRKQMEKLQCNRDWKCAGFAFDFFEDNRLLPAQQKSMGSLAGSLVKAKCSLNDESNALSPDRDTAPVLQVPNGKWLYHPINGISNVALKTATSSSTFQKQ